MLGMSRREGRDRQKQISKESDRGRKPAGRGGGVRLQYKNARMCVLKGSSAYFIPILWCNVTLKCIIPKGHSRSVIF